ncbi:hypothetical protein BSIN_3484 [Burkholderia singularis]|uniref:Uncharacterized protein n=1 Tax=Burkholderia singularis TaxID=1503053 RepID=A0A238HBG5_9BURK|nr:hypothetical protein BSIN_3484 [Burkholderia singularis]
MAFAPANPVRRSGRLFLTSAATPAARRQQTPAMHHPLDLPIMGMLILCSSAASPALSNWIADD